MSTIIERVGSGRPASADANVDELIAQVIESGEGPFETALTSPPAAYRSKALYDLEVENILAHEWNIVGRACELPNAGDYFTFAVAEEEIIVLRDGEGAIRAFPNVCLHRVSRLMTGRGNVRRITCPYHAWSYDLNGALVSAPYMNDTPGFDTSCRALRSLRTEVFEDMIFVSLDDEIEPVAERFAGLCDVIDGFGVSDHVHVFTFDIIFETNWKLVVENFESLHVFTVHPKSYMSVLQPLSEMEFSPELADQFSWHVLRFKEPVPNPKLPEHQRTAFPNIGLFPAGYLGVTPDRSGNLCLQPQGPRRTWIRYVYSISPDVLGGQDLESYWEENLKGQVSTSLEEDESILNTMQLDSRYAQRSPLSRLERHVWEFQRYLARRYRAFA